MSLKVRSSSCWCLPGTESASDRICRGGRCWWEPRPTYWCQGYNWKEKLNINIANLCSSAFAFISLFNYFLHLYQQCSVGTICLWHVFEPPQGCKVYSATQQRLLQHGASNLPPSPIPRWIKYERPFQILKRSLLEDHVVVGVVEGVTSHHPHQTGVYQSLVGRPTWRLSWWFDTGKHPESLSRGNR